MTDRKEKFTPDEVNFTDYMVEKIAAAIRGGEIMGTVTDENIKGDLERLACLISAAPDMYTHGEETVELMRRLVGMLPFGLDDEVKAQMAKWEDLAKKARGEE